MKELYLTANDIRKAEYCRLFLGGKLNEYLHSVDVECFQKATLLIAQMKEVQGVTERLKAENQMQWVGVMNNIRHSAEEIVLREIVYR